MKQTILFFCEAVTLSHIVQPLVLANYIKDKYNVVFACSQDRNQEIIKTGFKVVHLYSQSAEEFSEKLYFGNVIFTHELIERYIKDEIEILNELKPDIIVGDFRLTLKISAKLAKIPYISINNFYWSEFCEQKINDIPDGAVKKYFGQKIGKIAFDLLFPIVSKFHLLPFQRICKEYKIDEPKTLKEMYCNGDFILYGDIPEIFNNEKIPDNHIFLGPIPWEPDMAIPKIILDNNDKKMIYYSPGSSGKQDKEILEAFKDFDGIVLITKAQKDIDFEVFDNMLVFDFLPAIKISKMKNLVLAITNGGVGTYTFLANGIPVMTNPSNMYQHLFSEVLRNCGQEILTTKSQLHLFLDRIKHEKIYTIEEFFQKNNQKEIFLKVIENISTNKA